tara:strand:- start:1464 stop:2867 length:1404 start_codon:yes stop_codon:yes gene_type:complete
MINKIYKRIHSKYSKFFKYFFFLRYLFTIFFIAIFLFLTIPKFFNYDKDQDIIKEYLLNNYDLELKSTNFIKYRIFPFPNLNINNINFKVKDKPVFFKTSNLKIFLDLKSIYAFKNLKINKIVISQSHLDLEINKSSELLKYFAKIKSKLEIKNLDLILKKKDNSVVKIKKINYLNHGLKKDKIKGKIFDKKFEIFLDRKSKNLRFALLNTGIEAKFYFDQINEIGITSGNSKINILDNYLKLNFLIKDNKLKIDESNLRNKYFALSFDSLIKFDPYFEINSNIIINKIDKKFIHNLKLENILENKEILKRLNSNNKILFKKKLSWNDLIQNHFLEFNLAYGRLNYSTEVFFVGGKAKCQGDALLTDDYPRLNFKCVFNIKDKKKFLKKLSIVKNLNQNSINLDIVGSLNLLNKRISFKKIDINSKNVVQEEDLLFFKENFEKFLFNQGFFNIFRKDKIKEFILEVI